MIYFGFFIVELVILYFLSRRLVQLIYNGLFALTNSKNKSIYLLSILFLPGTFIHEMSHFIMALFLLVPVGELNLIPEVEEGGVKLGSVGIGKSDIVRRFLVGIAPLIVGNLLILGSLYYVASSDIHLNPLIIGGLFLLLFEIGNTMFSSKRDLEGVIELVVILVLGAVIIYLLGIRVDLSNFVGNEIFKLASIYSLATIFVDIIAILFLKMF